MSSRTAAPSRAPALARALRARVTSLASSGASCPSGVAGIGCLQLGDVGGLAGVVAGVVVVVTGGGAGVEDLDQHGADAVAPPLGALRGELDPLHPHPGPGDGDPAQVLGEQAPHGVDVVVGELDTEVLGQL